MRRSILRSRAAEPSPATSIPNRTLWACRRMSGSSARGAATDLASPGLLSVAGTTIQIPAPTTLPLRGLDLLRASRNIIAAWTSEHYRIPIVEHRFFGRRLFVLNDPAAIQHVLLDNASNYEKSLIARRLLAPALGRG